MFNSLNNNNNNNLQETYTMKLCQKKLFKGILNITLIYLTLNVYFYYI